MICLAIYGLSVWVAGFIAGWLTSGSDKVDITATILVALVWPLVIAILVGVALRAALTHLLKPNAPRK